MEQAMTGSGRRRTVVMVFAGGIAAQLLTIGIARFSFTTLLPVMLEQTALSPVTGGLLGGAIYAGYLAATLLLSLVRAPATRWARIRAALGTLIPSVAKIATAKPPA